MRRRRYIALAVAGGLSGCLGLVDDGGDDGSDGGDPPGDGGDAPGNGDDPDTGDGSGDGDSGGGVSLERRWREQIDVSPANLDYDAAVGDGAVFVGHDGGLAALELADGTTRWLRDEFSEFTAVHADDGGVVAVADGDVFEVASDSGEVRFRDPVDGSTGGLTRAGLTARLAFVSTDAGTTVYERGTGERVTDYGTVQSDVVTGEETTVLTPPNETIGVDSATGEEVWRADARTGPGGAIAGGRLVVVDPGDLETGTVYGHDTANGERLWEATVTHGNTGFVGVAIIGGVVVCVPDREADSVLHAFDAATGTEQWTENLGNLTNPFDPPAVDDGVVVAETADDVRAFDAGTGETLATTDRPFSIRAGIAGEGVFVQWADEDVTAYEL